jgi:hypothetical protein
MAQGRHKPSRNPGKSSSGHVPLAILKGYAIPG